MNTKKLFLAVVVIITVNLNSIKVESTAWDESNYELNPSTEDVVDEIEDKVDEIEDEIDDEFDPSYEDELDDESLITELGDDDYELEPEFITRILLIGGCPNILEQMLICMAVENLLFDVDLTARYAPSPNDSASGEQDEPEKCELYESENAPEGLSTRLYCPRTKNSAESVYAASAEGQIQNQGFYVQPNETEDGVDVLDKNRELIQTIKGKDLAEAAENLSREDLVYLA